MKVWKDQNKKERNKEIKDKNGLDQAGSSGYGEKCSTFVHVFNRLVRYLL
jgi:hypothetical protein